MTKRSLRVKLFQQAYFRQILLLEVLFLFSAHTLAGQLLGKHKEYKEYEYKGMRYGLFKPAHYNPGKHYPLIVYLHGSNDTVSRDLQWYQEETQSKNPCFVLTPKCLEADQGWGNTWQEGHTEATAKTLVLADSLVKSYSIDVNRLYLYGISMGGFGVFSVLAKNPGKFAAAYVVCGGSNEKAASKLIGTPLWIFHGEMDDVVSIQYSKAVHNEMLRLGGRKVRFTEYPRVKHNSWENVSHENTLSQWLFSQEKGKISKPPDLVKNFSVESQSGATIKLKWDSASFRSQPEKEVWYYKLFRDSALIAEVDGDVNSYTDADFKTGVTHTYHIIAVNYFFLQSNPSLPVRIHQ